MNTGDLIFVRGKGPVSETIEIVDGGPFSHVCMAMPYNTITESQYIVNTRDIPNPYKESEITVVDLGLTDEERQALVNLHFKYLPYKYDLKQDIGILLHKLFNCLQTDKTWVNKNELICSRYMVYLLNDIDYFKNHAYFYDTSYLTPNSLYTVLAKLKDTQPIAR
jgi:hypothetical protein